MPPRDLKHENRNQETAILGRHLKGGRARHGCREPRRQASPRAGIVAARGLDPIGASTFHLTHEAHALSIAEPRGARGPRRVIVPTRSSRSPSPAARSRGMGSEARAVPVELAACSTRCPPRGVCPARPAARPAPSCARARRLPGGEVLARCRTRARLVGFSDLVRSARRAARAERALHSPAWCRCAESRALSRDVLERSRTSRGAACCPASVNRPPSPGRP